MPAQRRRQLVETCVETRQGNSQFGKLYVHVGFFYQNIYNKILKIEKVYRPPMKNITPLINHSCAFQIWYTIVYSNLNDRVPIF